MSVRDLFPPDMATQRAAFAQALTWLFGETHRPAGRGARRLPCSAGPRSPQVRCHATALRQHADALCSARMRSHLSDRWDDGLAGTARDAVELIVGVMRGAADAEKGPPYRDGTVIEHIRATRDVSIVRLQLDHPLSYHPGQYVTVAGATVAAPLALPEPVDPRRPRGRHRVPRPFGHRRHGQHRDRRRDADRRPVATVQPARRHARRPRRRRRADGGGQHRAGPAADADHGPDAVRGEPAGAPVLRRPLPVRALRPAHAVADRLAAIRGCR